MDAARQAVDTLVTFNSLVVCTLKTDCVAKSEASWACLTNVLLCTGKARRVAILTLDLSCVEKLGLLALH